MKKLSFAITVAFMVLFLFTSCKAKKQETSLKTFTLRLAEINTQGHPTAQADKEFARLVEEKTQGRIKIEVFAGGSLYNNESAAIEALKTGDIDFTRVSIGPLSTYVPQLNVIQLPYLYKNAKHMWDVLNSPIGQTMLEDVKNSYAGLIGLCYYDAGARSFYLTKEVHNVADLKGLKIRVQNNPLAVRMCELLGATGVTGIGTGEISSAISSGLVDGAENNWPTYQSTGDYKVAKYYVLDQHTRVPEILLGSSKTIESLDAQDIKVIKDAAKQTQDFEIQKWSEQEQLAKKTIEQAGNIIIDLSPNEYAAFQEKMTPLYKEFASEYQDMIAAIKAIK